MLLLNAVSKSSPHFPVASIPQRSHLPIYMRSVHPGRPLPLYMHAMPKIPSALQRDLKPLDIPLNRHANHRCLRHPSTKFSNVALWGMASLILMGKEAATACPDAFCKAHFKHNLWTSLYILRELHRLQRNFYRAVYLKLLGYVLFDWV